MKVAGGTSVIKSQFFITIILVSMLIGCIGFSGCMQTVPENPNEAGDLFLKQGNCGDAVRYYEQALVSDSENPYTLIKVGSCYHSLKKYDESLKYYNRTLEVYEKYALSGGSSDMSYEMYGNIFAARALVYKDMGKCSEAVDDLNKGLNYTRCYRDLVTSKPPDPACHKMLNYKADCLSTLGRTEEAKISRGITSYNEVPEKVFSLYIQAMNAYDKGDYHGAISALDESIQIYPYYPDVWILRGKSYEQLGNRDHNPGELNLSATSYGQAKMINPVADLEYYP